MAYGNFKDLARRTASDKALKDKAFKINQNPNYDGYQRGLASIVYELFESESAGGCVTTLANKSSIKNQIT